jgi:SAM-dependent methyltransferase
MISVPLRPTWRRWWQQSRSRYSLLRGLAYEQLARHEFRGRTLDVGGGERADYRARLRTAGRVDSVNLSARIAPTVVADLNRPLPFRDASFDNVVSLNTFEHVRDDQLAICEMLRVLRAGGTFHVMVPFLYRVHATPADYHRHTASWWVDFLCAHGAAPDDLVVEPLAWDPVGAAFSLVEFTRVRRVAKPIALARAVVFGQRGRRGDRLGDEYGARAAEYAVGYSITGVKCESS